MAGIESDTSILGNIADLSKGRMLANLDPHPRASHAEGSHGGQLISGANLLAH